MLMISFSNPVKTCLCVVWVYWFVFYEVQLVPGVTLSRTWLLLYCLALHFVRESRSSDEVRWSHCALLNGFWMFVDVSEAMVSKFLVATLIELKASMKQRKLSATCAARKVDGHFGKEKSPNTEDIPFIINHTTRISCFRCMAAHCHTFMVQRSKFTLSQAVKDSARRGTAWMRLNSKRAQGKAKKVWHLGRRWPLSVLLRKGEQSSR